MITTLAVSLLLPTAPLILPAAHRTDPPVIVRLSDDFYFRGERAKVRVKVARDGYLLVLRMDGEGRIRPLFPVDPADSSQVRGGKEYEIRGRGDREGFTVDERDGVGYVFAAISESPFDFSSFSRGGHWDYRTLSGEEAADDPETRLLDLADSMATARFEYDLATYTVGADRRDRASSHGWFGHPRYYNPWYHSYSPFFGSRFGFGFGIVIGGGRRYHRRWF